MSAPFPLPDTMDVLEYPSLTLLDSGLPCRQVPQFMSPQFAFSAGTEKPVYTITHRVDFDFSASVLEASERVDRSEYVLNPTRALLVYMGPVELLLVVAWVEDRYSNTPKDYCRAYCWRESRTFP